VARSAVACKLGVEADAFRVGLQPEWHTRVPEGTDPCLPPDVLKDYELATASVSFDSGSRQIMGFSPRGPDESAEASNNWAISPRRSSTGRPILANDPHRAYSIPSLRYLVHLSASGLNVIGAGEPCLPGISIGHNGAIAFGLTIFGIDQEDLYIYDIDPADPSRYRYKGNWEQFRVIEERVRVRDAPDATVRLLFSRHGPVVHVDAQRHRAYAIRSVWFEPGTAAYFGSFAYMRAKSFAEF